MNLTTKKSKAKAEIKDEFLVDENETMDICGFSDGEVKIEGTLLRSFSFDSQEEPVELSINTPSSLNSAEVELTSNKSSGNFDIAAELTLNKNLIKSNNKKDILDYRTLKANPNGRTPSVDGEIYDMIRTYTLRRSTVRILSKIKAIHIDDNVYLNTIVDEAIRYYYEYLKSTNEWIISKKITYNWTTFYLSLFNTFS